MISAPAPLLIEDFDVRARIVNPETGEAVLEFKKGNRLQFEVPLSEFLASARKVESMKVSGQQTLSSIDVLRCAIYAQEESVRVLRMHFANTPIPNVIIEHNGGVINSVISDVPVNVIFLDEDTEGAEDDGVMEINGEERYLSQWLLRPGEVTEGESSGLSPAHVKDILLWPALTVEQAVMNEWLCDAFHRIRVKGIASIGLQVRLEHLNRLSTRERSDYVQTVLAHLKSDGPYHPESLHL